jgi:hypothetical protein
MEPVISIYELRMKAKKDEKYATLAIIAAANLGCHLPGFEEAIKWLNTEADWSTEEGVVAEINFCRDLV